MKQEPRADPKLLQLTSAEWHHEGSAISQLIRQGAGANSDSKLLSAVGHQIAERLLQMTMHWGLPSCRACSCYWLLSVGLGVQALALRLALGPLLRKRKLSGRALGTGCLRGQEVGVSMLILAATRSHSTCEPDDVLCIL